GAVPKPKKRKAPVPTSGGPIPLVKKRLERLPQVFDVWQADFRQIGPRVEEDGELFLPWLVLVTSRSSGLAKSQTMALAPPSSNILWDQLAEAMEKPLMDEPHRPTELQVRPDDRWDALTPH